MSEREVRKYAYHSPNCQVMSPLGDKVILPCDCGYLEAVGAEPDVVVLLRYVRQEREKANKVFDATNNEAAGIVGAASELIGMHIEQKFHVRLTLDGWEWID